MRAPNAAFRTVAANAIDWVDMPNWRLRLRRPAIRSHRLAQKLTHARRGLVAVGSPPRRDLTPTAVLGRFGDARHGADGLCYTLYSGEDSPSEAENRCEDRGGHLAKVTTAGQIADPALGERGCAASLGDLPIAGRWHRRRNGSVHRRRCDRRYRRRTKLSERAAASPDLSRRREYAAKICPGGGAPWRWTDGTAVTAIDIIEDSCDARIRCPMAASDSITGNRAGCLSPTSGRQLDTCRRERDHGTPADRDVGWRRP